MYPVISDKTCRYREYGIDPQIPARRRLHKTFKNNSHLQIPISRQLKPYLLLLIICLCIRYLKVIKH